MTAPQPRCMWTTSCARITRIGLFVICIEAGVFCPASGTEQNVGMGNSTTTQESSSSSDSNSNVISSSQKIAELDQQIMLECIKLARFNIQFHVSLNRKTFFQEWLYPMTREAGTALSFSNTVIDLTQRSKGLSDLSRISKPAQKTGLKCALIGQSITGASSGYSLATNLLQSLRARQQGYSPARALSIVKSISDTIDKLLAQRDAIVARDDSAPMDKEYASQRRLLEHVRNQLVFEFKTWSIQSRLIEWSENTFFAIDSLQGFTQLASSCTSLRAFSNADLGGAAAITNLVANAMVMCNPSIKSLAGRLAARIERRRLSKVFGESTPKQFNEILSELGASSDIARRNDASSAKLQELSFLARRSSEMDAGLNSEVSRLGKLRQIADQQALSGSLIGLSGVSRGILNTTAFYCANSSSGSSSGSTSSSSSSGSSSGSSSSSSGSSNNSRGKILSNQLNFAGRVVQSTGQMYSLIVTPATEVKHYFYKRKLSRSGALPDQILKARMARLDELESRIKKFQY